MDAKTWNLYARHTGKREESLQDDRRRREDVESGARTTYSRNVELEVPALGSSFGSLSLQDRDFEYEQHERESASPAPTATTASSHTILPDTPRSAGSPEPNSALPTGRMSMSDPQYRQYAAERIRELNEIDKLIPQLVFEAAAAMKAIAGKTKASSSAEALEANKAEFTKAATHYFELINDVFTRLRVEIGHIERVQQEANNPGSGGSTEDDAAKATEPSSSAAKDGDGLGSLDPGWLNSRMNGGGADFELGLWKQMEKLMEHCVAVQKGEKVDELPEYLQEGSDDEHHERGVKKEGQDA